MTLLDTVFTIIFRKERAQWCFNGKDADAENQTLRYRELERKVVGITATMLTKCLKELEKDKFIKRKQYNTIPPTVEYSLSERGKTLIPALESVYNWADEQMKNRS